VLLRTIEGAAGRMSRGGENNGSVDPGTGRAASTSFSLLIFDRLRAQRSALSDVFAFASFSQVNVLVDGQPEINASAQLISGNYHAGLGVPAFVGRTLTPDDDRVSAAPVAVISFRYWTRRFGGTPDILGKTIQINRVPTVIVGVTPQGFDGAMQAGESVDVLAVTLAAVGLYGLMSHAVLRRTGEIGLRMAVGARPADVLGMILRESLALVGVGLALGAAGAYGAGRLVASMLFELSPTDPITYGVVALVLLMIAALASLLPARRAGRIDPMVALKVD